MDFLEAGGAMIASLVIGHSVARITLMAVFHFLKRPRIAVS